MTGRVILAIDPGMTGALAFIDHAGELIAVHDMPVVSKEIDAAGLADLIAQASPSAAIIERVASRPGEAPRAAFTFGRTYGTAIGIVAALDLPMHLVTPPVWKKHHRIPADKEAARALALRLWPGHADRFKHKKDAGRAEAALIGRYAIEALPAFNARAAA